MLSSLKKTPGCAGTLQPTALECFFFLLRILISGALLWQLEIALLYLQLWLVNLPSYTTKQLVIGPRLKGNEFRYIH